jgi:hypothetical protein
MDGQGVKQFLELGSAFVISAAIGWNAKFAIRVRGCALIRSSELLLPFFC